mmetsp:Transcript_20500/g.32777  ORF Transcript_20500/g.32777 Transcript_20500/m.32777 type:complete len:337 (-) Transcript_20500:997-2007(-)
MSLSFSTISRTSSSTNGYWRMYKSSLSAVMRKYSYTMQNIVKRLSCCSTSSPPPTPPTLSAARFSAPGAAGDSPCAAACAAALAGNMPGRLSDSTRMRHNIVSTAGLKARALSTPVLASDMNSRSCSTSPHVDPTAPAPPGSVGADCTTSSSLSTYWWLHSACTCCRTESSAGGKCDVFVLFARLLVCVTHVRPAAVSTATCVCSVSICMSSSSSSISTSSPCSRRRCCVCRTCASSRDAQMANIPRIRADESGKHHNDNSTRFPSKNDTDSSDSWQQKRCESSPFPRDSEVKLATHNRRPPAPPAPLAPPGTPNSTIRPFGDSTPGQSTSLIVRM